MNKTDPAQNLYKDIDKRDVDSFAMWGFVLSLSSIFLGFISVLALALSIAGLVRISKDKTKKGRGFAIAGVITSGIISFFMIFAFFVFLLLLVS